MKYCTVYCTAPNKEDAERISTELVKKKLVACCNIIEGVTSVFVWQGELNKDEEVLIIMKTRTELFKKVRTEIKKLHKYEVPEIIAMPIEAVNDDYAKWMDEQTDYESKK